MSAALGIGLSMCVAVAIRMLVRMIAVVVVVVVVVVCLQQRTCCAMVTAVNEAKRLVHHQHGRQQQGKPDGQAKWHKHRQSNYVKVI